MKWHGIIWGVNFLVFVIFWNNSPKNILESLRLYNRIDLIYPGSTSITSNPFNEHERILSIFKLGIVPNVQTWIILILMLTIFFYAINTLKNGVHTMSFMEIRLVVVILCSFLGLLFATSKWASYYGVLISSFMVLLFIVLKNNQKYRNYFFFFTVILTYFYSFSRDWNSSIFEMPYRSSTSIYIQNVKSMPFAMLAISIILILVFLYIFKLNFIRLTTTLNLVFIFTYIFNPVVDSFLSNNGWTFIEQSIKGVYSKSERCGLAHLTKLTKNQELSVQEFESNISGSTVLTPGNFFYSPCLKPISTKYGRWEMPNISVGLQIFDQQRLLLETDLNELGCDPILKLRNDLEQLDYCFYKIQSSIPEIGIPDKSEFLF
jgi:hypothetical protein